MFFYNVIILTSEKVDSKDSPNVLNSGDAVDDYEWSEILPETFFFFVYKELQMKLKVKCGNLRNQ